MICGANQWTGFYMITASVMKGLRKTYFPDYMTFTCLNKAYQNFIFKLSKVFDLLCPSKKFEANSKPWIDSETISAICRRDKL